MGEIDYTIEPFDPLSHDGAQIAAMHRAIREEQVADGTASFSDIEDSQPDLTNITDAYLKPGGAFFVAQERGTLAILGFVGLRPTEDDTARLQRLAVQADYRENGIGYALVGTVVAWAKSSPFNRLTLFTGRLQKGRNIYKEHGFNPIGYNGPRHDYLMEHLVKSEHWLPSITPAEHKQL